MDDDDDWSGSSFDSSDFDDEGSLLDGVVACEYPHSSLMMAMTSSSPAIMAMNQLNATTQPPLVDPEERKRSELLRVDSQPSMMINNSNSGLPPALLQRMQRAECAIGNENPANYNLSHNPSILTSNELLAMMGRSGDPQPIDLSQTIPPSPPPVFPALPMKTMNKESPSCSTTCNTSTSEPTNKQTNPQVYLKTLLEQQGIAYKTYPALELGNFFLRMGDANILGYDMPKAAAVRTNDVNALRQMLHQGQTLQVCNRFGESIVNNACRRGSLDIMKFLLEEASVSLKVMDDYGRTALHDACWTHVPCFELVALLLDHCPDLLLVQDRRGSTPLQYVRQQYWGEWCQFLEHNKGKLLPRDLK
jgi:hypothetical protein